MTTLLLGSILKNPSIKCSLPLLYYGNVLQRRFHIFWCIYRTFHCMLPKDGCQQCYGVLFWPTTFQIVLCLATFIFTVYSKPLHAIVTQLADFLFFVRVGECWEKPHGILLTFKAPTICVCNQRPTNHYKHFLTLVIVVKIKQALNPTMVHD